MGGKFGKMYLNSVKNKILDTMLLLPALGLWMQCQGADVVSNSRNLAEQLGTRFVHVIL